MAASSPNVADVPGQESSPTEEDGQQASCIPAPSSSSELTKRVSVRTSPKQKPLTEKETSFDVLESSELEQRKRIARLTGINLDSLRSADGKPLSAEDVLKVVSAGCRDETHTGRSGSRKSQGGASSADESLYSSPALAEKVQYRSTASPTGRHRSVSQTLVPIKATARKSVQVQLFELLKGNSNRVLELFKEWDTDGNGAVDKMELRKGIAGLGYSVPNKEIDFLFDCFDKDGSGEIAYSEFKKMLSEESLAHALEAADPEMRRKAKERQLRLTRRLSRESKEYRYLHDHEEERPDSPIAFESFMLLKSMYATRKPEETSL
ncbi:hypothetical protein Ctob_002187 [Chrysochromulina tobinii]|uniref:EF-hand domain-containing protein n=1 Tax=Chrysochromulina tobinii TaxID=1460289 RepID=A0A0M0J6I8_9EUKA|nr:hypothetical protein Ctob_002187 [Chrysochromulina tobinii]|eukprot:KOO21843.1 hypothetical protein Ctob_002187 [Chrysochromulina sp. CCMP291]